MEMMRAAFVLLCCLIGHAGAADAEPTDWPCWRGADQNGHAGDRDKIYEWSPASTGSWRATIPGAGHSSPIVSADAVYCTTVCETTRQSGFQKWLRRLEIALVALTLLPSVVLTHRYIRERPVDTLQAKPIVGLFLAILIGCCVLCGAELFDFQRCPVRAWIVSTVVLTACLYLTAVWQEVLGRKSFVVAALLLVLGCAVLFWFPSKDHSFRGGILANNTLVAIIVALLPMGLGTGLAINGWLNNTPDPKEGAIAKVPQPGSLRRALLLIGVAIPVLPLGIFMFKAWAQPVDEADGIVFQSALPFYWVLIAVVLYGGLAAILRRRQSSRLIARWLVAIAGVTAACMLVLWLLCFAIGHVDYLRYHYGKNDLRISLASEDAWLLLGIVGLVGSAMGLSTRFGAKGFNPPPMLILLLPVGLGVQYFVFTNSLSKEVVLARTIVRLDRRTGEVEWSRGVASGVPFRGHRDNSGATSTPVVHGGRIYAFFGEIGLFCLDGAGTTLWQRRDVPFKSPYGVGWSLVCADGRIILPARSEEGAFLCAFDADSGGTIWKMPCIDDSSLCGLHRTPLVLEIGGTSTLVMAGRDEIAGYAVSDGRELWKAIFKYPGGDPVASLVANDRFIFLSGRTSTIAFDREKLPRETDAITWRWKGQGANCSSPVLWEDRLLVVSDSGQVTILDATTGEEVWKHRIRGERFFASSIVCGGVAYLSSLDGETFLIDMRAPPRVIGQNSLGEGIYASPAVANGQLFLRGTKSVICVGARE